MEKWLSMMTLFLFMLLFQEGEALYNVLAGIVIVHDTPESDEKTDFRQELVLPAIELAANMAKDRYGEVFVF